MNMLLDHVAAWLRGDLDKIVGGVDKLCSTLSQHVAYLRNQANAKRDAATTLLNEAKVHTSEADRAFTALVNIEQLLGK